MKTTSSLTLSGHLRNSGGPGRVFAGLFGILAMLFLGTALCRAGSGGVIDNGAFFSEQAKSDAVKVIAEMERTLRKGLLIETFKEIPENVKAGVKTDDKAAMSKMYDQWAVKQAKQHGVNGVYVLIVKSPPHLQAEVGTDTQQQAFTMKDRAALVSLMIGKLGAKQSNEALRDGVNFVQSTMKSHLPNRARTGAPPVPASSSHPAEKEKSGGSGWIIQFIVIGLVVWVVIGIIRAISNRAGGGAMGQPGMSGGGGGFFSSLIGGMFGAAAGMWMYDQFFSSHSNSAYGADRNDQNSGDSGFSGQDNDYSGGGDDFGGGSDSGSSGGGDSGGGDSGGGDF